MKQRKHYPHRFFEKEAWQQKMYVCGIDEVGRGCLAGPVVVAAAIIPPNTRYPLLQDSKILSQAEREKAYTWISKNGWFTTAFADLRLIEEKNIYHATRIAMQKALLGLVNVMPFNQSQLKYVVVDAVKLHLPFSLSSTELHSMPFAETVSPCVAAASIVAKITRDALMQRIAPLFPAYKLAQHKGYATTLHLQSLTLNNASIIHRPSFVSHLITKQGWHGAQQSLF